MRILISGATGSLGRALALALTQQNPNCELILLGRKEERLAALDDQIRAAGGNAPLLVPLDFTSASPAHIKELAQNIEADGLDALVLGAAMHTGLHPLDHLKPVDFDKITRVGLYGPFWLIHHLLPLLKAAKSGKVLGIADNVGAQAKPFWGAYGIAKSGFDTLLEQLRQEAENSVEVRRVCPPAVSSPLRGLVYPAEDPTSLTPPAEVVSPWAEWLLTTSD